LFENVSPAGYKYHLAFVQVPLIARWGQCAILQTWMFSYKLQFR
jgi:hypothetical protein